MSTYDQFQHSSPPRAPPVARTYTSNRLSGATLYWDVELQPPVGRRWFRRTKSQEPSSTSIGARVTKVAKTIYHALPSSEFVVFRAFLLVAYISVTFGVSLACTAAIRDRLYPTDENWPGAPWTPRPPRERPVMSAIVAEALLIGNTIIGVPIALIIMFFTRKHTSFTLGVALLAFLPVIVAFSGAVGNEVLPEDPARRAHDSVLALWENAIPMAGLVIFCLCLSCCGGRRS